MKELSAGLGVTWASVQSLTVAGHAIKFTYSLEGPPHLELVEGPEGSIWEAPDGGYQHHVGYWTDDMRGDRARLAAAGLEVTLEIPGATYHSSASGLRIELVDERARPALERWFAGGDFA